VNPMMRFVSAAETSVNRLNSEEVNVSMLFHYVVLSLNVAA
jgi:hypothetical protein